LPAAALPGALALGSVLPGALALGPVLGVVLAGVLALAAGVDVPVVAAVVGVAAWEAGAVVAFGAEGAAVLVAV
jgi:hypothetical protein